MATNYKNFVIFIIFTFAYFIFLFFILDADVEKIALHKSNGKNPYVNLDSTD